MNYDTTIQNFKLMSNSQSNYYSNYQLKQENDTWINDNSNNLITTIDGERHMQELMDKKKKKRESHNAVERRRRDNINERIFELSTLLPDRDAIKTSKGIILRKSVDHIRLLHDKVNEYQQRIQELESILNMYRMKWGDLNQTTSATSTNYQ